VVKEPVMSPARRPAAYIPGAAPHDREALALATRQRGWPAPVVYADDEPGASGHDVSALNRLETAISAGRHDALLIAMRGTLGDTAALMRLLSRCTQQGVTVAFVPRPQPPYGVRPYQSAAGDSAPAAS
jgi:hypothetical protein